LVLDRYGIAGHIPRWRSARGQLQAAENLRREREKKVAEAKKKKAAEEAAARKKGNGKRQPHF
jgi:hypothetical protein